MEILLRLIVLMREHFNPKVGKAKFRGVTVLQCSQRAAVSVRFRRAMAKELFQNEVVKKVLVAAKVSP